MPKWNIDTTKVPDVLHTVIGPLVSINIGTFNSMKTLPDCIESIKEQNYENYEIIALDSYSTDGTIDYIRSIGGLVVFGDTLGSARKLGAIESKGKYVFIMDSDQKVTGELISKAVERAEEEFDAITVWEKPIEVKTWVQKLHAYEKYLFHNMEHTDAYTGDAIPRFFRSSYYKQVDFDRNPPQTMEHNAIWEQIQNMGARSSYIPYTIWHRDPATIRDLWRKFFRNGFYYLEVLRHHKRLAFHHSMPRNCYFSKEVMMKPKVFAAFMYIYFIKATATLCGVLYSLCHAKTKNFGHNPIVS